jgi:hypothetical protein
MSPLANNLAASAASSVSSVVASETGSAGSVTVSATASASRAGFAPTNAPIASSLLGLGLLGLAAKLQGDPSEINT